MKKLLAALAVSTACIATQAIAADDGPVMMQKDWFIKVGGTYVAPDSAGTLPFVGFPVTVGNTFTGSAEAGRFLNDRFSLSLSAGLPPTHDILVAGSKAGTVTLGAFALDGQFHVVNDSPIDLYVGGGLAYNVYFSNTVPGVSSVDSGFAPVLQAGVEYKISDSVGLFADVKKEFFTTTVHHIKLGPYQERLDPLAVTVGLALHF
ncbi:MAG: OmpW family protein [Alphaproteobacteria bacterium]|nr:OmpW family protein [Alphaproteobacteria bacterium]